MTIKKGETWGEPGTLPPDGVVVSSDAEARAALEAARRKGQPFPVLGIVGGDLLRTVGGSGQLTTTFPVDLGEILVDGRLHLFVAHAVARTRTWSRVWAAMNAQWLGEWNAAPRGHPNDGRLDVYDAKLSVSDRFKVRSRIRSGAHLPHPGIKERRTAAVQVEFARPTDLFLDGEAVGSARTLSVRLEPDAIRVVA